MCFGVVISQGISKYKYCWLNLVLGNTYTAKNFDSERRKNADIWFFWDAEQRNPQPRMFDFFSISMPSSLGLLGSPFSKINEWREAQAPACFIEYCDRRWCCVSR